MKARAALAVAALVCASAAQSPQEDEQSAVRAALGIPDRVEQIRALRSLLERFPENREIHLRLGFFWMVAGGEQTALEHLEKTYGAPDTARYGAFYAGQIHLAADRLDEAQSAYRRAREATLEYAARHPGPEVERWTSGHLGTLAEELEFTSRERARVAGLVAKRRLIRWVLSLSLLALGAATWFAWRRTCGKRREARA